MKKIIAVLLLSASVFASCKDKSKLTIKGTLVNADAKNKVYLYGMASNSMILLDSTNLSQDGEFKFTSMKPEADFFRVNYGQNEYIVIAKNGDDVKISTDVNDESLRYEISGGEEANKLAEFNALKVSHQNKILAVSKQFETEVNANPDGRNELFNKFSPMYNSAIKELNTAIVNFALNNANSLVSFYAISLVNPKENEKEMVAYSEKVSNDLKKNAAVKNLVAKVARLKAVQIGQPAPDFTINNIKGEAVSLKDFKGKYVLLDFWASWCAPCRNENPNVVKAYQNFKGRNFTVVGISLDKDKSAWTQAISQDKLTWTHLGEFQDFEGPTVRLYQVEAIPSSFLIDPDGKIIARDLTGEDLLKFLDENLPK